MTTRRPRRSLGALALSALASCATPVDPGRGEASARASEPEPPRGEASVTWPAAPPRSTAAASLSAAVDPPPVAGSRALSRARSSSEAPGSERRPAQRLAVSPDGARVVALVGDLLGGGAGPELVQADSTSLDAKPVPRRLEGLVRALAIADDGAIAVSLVDGLVVLEGGRERVVSDVDAEQLAFDAKGALVVATRDGVQRLARGAARPTAVARMAEQGPVALAPGGRALLAVRGEVGPAHALGSAAPPRFVAWLEGEPEAKPITLPETLERGAPPSEGALSSTGHAVLLAGQRVLRAQLAPPRPAELVLELDFVPSRPALSPDGRLLAVRDASYRTRVLDLDARRELAHIAESVERVAWVTAPGGSRALVGATSSGLARWIVP